MPGGVVWSGDVDNEYIFGTDWLDNLSGGAGNDIMYGFEGDDTIIGGLGSYGWIRGPVTRAQHYFFCVE